MCTSGPSPSAVPVSPSLRPRLQDPEMDRQIGREVEKHGGGVSAASGWRVAGWWRAGWGGVGCVVWCGGGGGGVVRSVDVRHDAVGHEVGIYFPVLSVPKCADNKKEKKGGVSVQSVE